MHTPLLRRARCAPLAGIVLVVALATPNPSRAVGLCDVAPLAAPNGLVELADALLILRAAVRLIDPADLILARADSAPVELLTNDFVRVAGDGLIRSSDALVCLRNAIDLIQFPPNLVVEFQNVTPPRPPVNGMAVVRVRVENDGDSDQPQGTVVALRVGAPFDPPTAPVSAAAGAPVDVIAMFAAPLAPGAAQVFAFQFPAGAVPGNLDLFARVETAVPQQRDTQKSDTRMIVVNGFPTANAGADIPSTVEGTDVALSGSGTDPNGDALSFSWKQLSGTPVLNLTGTATATPSFKLPDILIAEDSVWELVTTDPDGLSSPPDTVEIRIEPINDNPGITIAAIPDTEEGTVIDLVATIVDPNQDPIVGIQWAKLQGPDGAFVDTDQATARFTIPDIAATTPFLFEVEATDSRGGVGMARIGFNGLRINQNPVAAATGPTSVLEGRDVVLDGSGSFDPDPSDQIELVWTQTAGVDVGLMADAAGVANFVAPETPIGETLEFELVVTDDFGGEDRLSHTLEVLPDPQFPVDVIVRPTPSATVVGVAASVRVEVEVLARDPSQIVADGTQVDLSATLGTLAGPAVVGTTLGLVTTTFAPGAVAGIATIEADVLSSSAAGQSEIGVLDQPDAVGQLRLSVDPPIVVAGSATPVTAIATAIAADEVAGVVADGTSLDFSASAGNFAAPSAPTASGIAVLGFTPPAQPGSIELQVASGNAVATATLEVIAAPSGSRVRFRTPALSVVGGGPPAALDLLVSPDLAGAALGAPNVAFALVDPPAADSLALLDGVQAKAVTATALPTDADFAPFGDFPGVSDSDADSDGVFSANSFVASVQFSHPAVAQPVVQVVGGISGGVLATTRVLVVPNPTDPGAVDLAAMPDSVVAGATLSQLSALVDSADGNPVADATAVDFRTSKGSLVPTQAATVGGEALTALSHPAAEALPARIRARAEVAEVADVTDLTVVPSANDPGALEVVLAANTIERDGLSQTLVSAIATLPDGSDAPDGTRVLFHASRGIPSAAFATTSAGVAEIGLTSSSEPGAFEVEARVAGSVVAARTRGSFADAGMQTVTFGLDPGVGIASLTVRVTVPTGAVALRLGAGVKIDLVPAVDGGIGQSAIAFANTPSAPEVIDIGIISASGFAGSGPLFRLSFELPPGADLGTPEGVDVLILSVTDVNAIEIPGVTIDCSIAGRDIGCPTSP